MKSALAGLLFVMHAGLCLAQEPVFSGPQPGEKLPAFKVRGVFAPDAGKDLDFVNVARGKPIVLVFVHDLNRVDWHGLYATSYTYSGQEA